MAVEKTLIVVKPDAYRRKLTGKILTRFEERGFGITDLKVYKFSESKAREFYSDHKDKKFFGELVSFITSGTVVACILEGEYAVSAVRKMLGKTQSYEAEPGSIRGDFALGISDNVIHASDSHDNFIKESHVIFG